MSAVNPYVTAAELKRLGWDADELQRLARQRARMISDTAMVLAEGHPAWAPLRGESYDSAMQRLDTALASGLGEYLALPAEDGDDDAALVASVAAEQEPTPELDPEQVALEERAAWEELEAQRERDRERDEARAAKRKEKLAERLTARVAAREDGF